ncbi:hypothetical protein ONE63_010382 [Megalurothrips usitatus]|uniref:Uncharacterized protein n=1 Tax=Megalurothrips usitatus TaxID=439358 RepID=A0AAV7XEQ0_9NEOP|nr:hypothetical protein ONE63_010382 [Megalurothrips usitatus]
MPHRHQATPAAARPTTPTTPEPEEPPFDGKFRAVYQNTYRLEPKRPWAEESVLGCLRDVMHEMLASAEYDVEKCAGLACSTAEEVRARVRELGFDRYKILCVVHIHEKVFQGIHSELGYLWDVHRDRFVTYTFSNTHIIATGAVFGVYYE